MRRISWILGLVIVGVGVVSMGVYAQATRPSGAGGAGGVVAPESNPANDQPRQRPRRTPDRAPVESGPVDSTRIPSPPPLSPDYDIILKRSLFYHGKFVPVDPAKPQGPSQPRQAPTISDYDRPENNIVFRGVTEEGSVDLVLLEDISVHGTKLVEIGQAIAPGLGKIVRASLDDLDYQPLSGKLLNVRLGQNLLGVTIADASTQPVVAGAESGAFGNGDSSGTPSDGGGPVSDIIAKLKAKRQAELGGGH